VSAGHGGGLIVDRARFAESSISEELGTRLAKLLDLSSIGASFDADVAAEIVSEQLETCLDHIFSHPIWSRFRSGEAALVAHAYLLETHHYLAAAPSRMAPGAAAAGLNRPALPLLAEHVVEEIGHEEFFVRALRAIGCDPEAVGQARPLPATSEWVHLMRSVASRGPIAAAICSGLLESSALDRDTVRQWHELLVQRRILPEPAVVAILGHLNVDEELGHGENWREVLRQEAPIATRELADALNAAATVAEMIVRWLDALTEGDSGHVVAFLRTSVADGSATDPTFAGLPVWPATVLARISHGGAATDGATRALAVAYHLPDAAGRDTPEQEAAAELRRLAEGTVDSSGPRGLESTARAWLRAIEGHELWSAMQSADAGPLISGWLLENYWYLRASPQHVCAAISACTDPSVRKILVAHLAEEADHHEILALGLKEGGFPLEPEATRPLPTTSAFVGALADMGRTDWRAYCLALVFLQVSLSTDPRHEQFYAEVVKGTPQSAPLTAAMRRHDHIDDGLGHEGQMQLLLEAVVAAPGGISPLSIQRAAVVPQLAWGFLDGIVQHYRSTASLIQRVAWS
jgi:pyrroloquinoline quinone (PQQ) biosynthesis protein C